MTTGDIGRTSDPGPAERKLRCLREIGLMLESTMSFDEVLNLLVEQTASAMEAERATLFLVDQYGGLFSRALKGDVAEEIRLAPGKGIAGWVAIHDHPLNIPDVSKDGRFDSAWDRKFEFVTRSLLCHPIRGRNNAVIGVIEVLNKRDGGLFDRDDEDLLGLIAIRLGLIVENSRLMVDLVTKNQALVKAKQSLERSNRELDLLLDLERLVSRSGDVEALTASILRRVIDMAHAEIGMIYRPDESGAEARVVIEGRPGYQVYRTGLGVGFAGWVSAKGKEINLAEPAADPRFDRYFETRIGVPIRNVAAVPLIGEGAAPPFPALHVANKRGAGRFDSADMAVLRLVAPRLAQAMEELAGREEKERERRLATVGRLLAGVLHDLKSPISVINGYAELLAAKAGGEESEDYLGHINSALRRITTMTEEIVSFSRGEHTLRIEEHDIQALADRFFEEVVPLLKANKVTLEKQIRIAGKARLDRDRMLRAFHNIAINAVEAMKGGGTLTVELDRLGDYLVFGFTDTGAGVPAEIHGSLFQSFVTLGKGHGTGLGLAVAREIVEAHGGTISFTTMPDSGTTFLIKIPLAPETGAIPA